MTDNNHFSNIRRYKKLIQVKNASLFSLIVLDLIFIVMHFTMNLNQQAVRFMTLFDYFTCLCLLLDMIFDYYRSDEDLKTFIKNNYLEIIAMLPINVSFIRFFAVFRLLRILHIYRKVRHVSNNMDDDLTGRDFIKENILIITSIFTVVYMIGLSISFRYFDSSINNVFDALWFNIVTISTVGYGDVVPLHLAGKLTTVLTVIVGSFFVSIFTAYLSALYNDKPESERRELLKKDMKELNLHANDLQTDVDKLDKNISRLEKNVNDLEDSMDNIITILRKQQKK